MHPNSTCFPFLPALLSYTYTLPIFPHPPKNHKAISGSMDHRYSHGLQWQHQPRTTGVFQGDSIQKTNHSLSQISCYAESGWWPIMFAAEVPCSPPCRASSRKCQAFCQACGPRGSTDLAVRQAWWPEPPSSSYNMLLCWASVTHSHICCRWQKHANTNCSKSLIWFKVSEAP